MYKLFSIDSGYKQSANLTRILSSIVVLAESKDEALLFAQRQYPESLASGAEHRVIEVDHVVVNWPDGSVVIVEKQHSKQLHC